GCSYGPPLPFWGPKAPAVRRGADWPAGMAGVARRCAMGGADTVHRVTSIVVGRSTLSRLLGSMYERVVDELPDADEQRVRCTAVSASATFVRGRAGRSGVTMSRWTVRVLSIHWLQPGGVSTHRHLRLPKPYIVAGEE